MEDFFLDIIILAAGNGNRMESIIPKPFHEINGIPLLTHLLNTLFNILSELKIQNQIHIVFNDKHLSYYTQHYSSSEYDDLNLVSQYKTLGTGHAVLQTIPFLQQTQKSKQAALILFADTLILNSNYFKQFIVEFYSNIQNNKLHIMSTIKNDPTNYGRIVRNKINEQIIQIKEEKDASIEIKKIQEVYVGPMLISLGPSKQFKHLLRKISNQNQAKEYYLTDLISIASQSKFSIKSFLVPEKSLIGINTKPELEIATQLYHQTFKINC